ncbi:hypothetical protein ERO13_A08G195600v2 [Gossypium hirsutum]|uniref:Protein CUP-SHAPED COTYLEDON 3 isoform X3 n=2 Tax=Gossypium TaxID=3633 RepID=A0A1U8MLS9_GOSHI|nr:protein CUP-SHAPED COTYLEDON 3-like isoform X3 [Gossypium hirsutum]KAG4188942.1 hypothetical protein ERO13_A08G195600v2 [Gossypium hirsutum]TYI16065.1 hypothetical protein ES332_A08G229300v1 [Gossypium tomentosum]
MNMVKGFRFHPTDEELIEYLQIKTFNRDSLVQVIAEIPDICESEPWELPGRSVLQTGDRLWYFMYPPKYKYRNSKLVSRTTLEGYWKITGKARKIINSETGMEIGNKKTLLFYKGQCNDKIKNNTCWVMHEYELKAMLDSTNSHQDILDPNGSSEPEASNNHNDVHNHCSSVDTYGDERSNQHNTVDEGEGSNISTNFVNHVAEDAIPEVPSHIFKVYQNGLEDNNWIQDLYSTNEQDDESWNSIITSFDETIINESSNQHNIVVAEKGIETPIISYDETITNERSNQHNIVVVEGGTEMSVISYDETVANERSNQHNIVDVDEGFEVPSNLKYLVEEDTISTDLLYKDGLYSRSLFGELLAEPEATNNLNWIQNRYITKKEDGEFLNSTLADKNKADLQEGNTQWCLAADGEGFSLPCIGALTESSNSMEKSSKRPRRM